MSIRSYICQYMSLATEGVGYDLTLLHCDLIYHNSNTEHNTDCHPFYTMHFCQSTNNYHLTGTKVLGTFDPQYSHGTTL